MPPSSSTALAADLEALKAQTATLWREVMASEPPPPSAALTPSANASAAVTPSGELFELQREREQLDSTARALNEIIAGMKATIVEFTPTDG